MFGVNRCSKFRGLWRLSSDTNKLQERREQIMKSSLRSLANVGRFGRFWAAMAIMGGSWAAVLPALAVEAIPADALYTVTYKVDDILSEIRSARHLEAAETKDYLEERVKGPAVAQLDWPKQREVRFGEMRCRDEDLTVVANRAGHEQVKAMFAAFRQFGEAEYVISVRFITLSDARMRDIFSGCDLDAVDLASESAFEFRAGDARRGGDSGGSGGERGRPIANGYRGRLAYAAAGARSRRRGEADPAGRIGPAVEYAHRAEGHDL
jgi:hypothetical protein